jgi:hypothetical protein
MSMICSCLLVLSSNLRFKVYQNSLLHTSPPADLLHSYLFGKNSLLQLLEFYVVFSQFSGTWIVLSESSDQALYSLYTRLYNLIEQEYKE